MNAGGAVGFIGLGQMGAPMAQRLLDAGHKLVIFDTRESVVREWIERGATGAQSPRHLGDAVQTVFLSLPTPDIVESVAIGPNESLLASAATHVVDLSTTGPDASRRIAKVLTDQGKHFVDAPVSGGVAGARAGKLAIMAACDSSSLDAVSPLLAIMGVVHHVGQDPGMGQMLKLINNLLSACALTVSSEAMSLAVKAGLNPKTVIDVINCGSGRNSATLDKFPRQILPRTFDAGFTLGLMAKDIDLCMKQAALLGLSLTACDEVRKIWNTITQELGPAEDFTKIILPIERAAGVVVRQPG